MGGTSGKAHPKKRAPRPHATPDQAYLATLLSHVNDGVVGADAEARVTYWSPGAERLFGFTAAEASGQTPFDLLRPAYRSGEREKIFADLDRDGAAVAVVRARHKNGKEIIVEVNAAAIADTVGRRAGYVIIYRDITERHRAGEELQLREQQLRAQADTIRMSEAELRGILNAAKESIWQFTPDGVILMGNKVAVDRFGLTAEQVIGRNFAEFVPPDVAASRLAKLREVAETRRPVEFEDTRAGMDFEHSYYPVLDESGRVASIACFSRDVTERRRMEQALRDRSRELQHLMGELETRVRERTAELAAANERLKAEADQRARLVAAVEQADEGVVIMDAEGRIHDVNAAFLRLSGRSRAELRSMSYRQLLPRPSGGQDPWADMKVSIDRNETWRGGVSRGGDGGEALELEVTLSPILDDAGRPISYLAVERDVTREVRLQQHLRQAQKLEALGTLAGGIAHDFNNILNPIFISTELLLLEPSLDPDHRRHLEVTLKAAERGRDLVKQIIAFSRQKERERKPFKVGPVVAEAVKFLRVSLPSTIEIRSDVREEADFILGDPAQIHQIVMNLCNNAAYAMRERGGVLSIGLAEIDVDGRLAAQVPALKPGPYLRLAVSDTGTGMSPQVRERAFDPFFTTKKAGEGSGLGLSVVAGIVRDYGGAISVMSEIDAGSAFAIYLPRVAVERTDPQAAPEGAPGGTERILLVDDEEVQARSLQGALTRLGYQVTALGDGMEALRRFREDPRSFDLLITDQTMPHLTGMRLSEEALALRPDLPIILCTGFSETVDAAGARALGVREFVMKPYSVREMAKTIRRALALGPARTPR